MADPLLQALREQIIDESEPLAGLLRKCLLLGAQTGSDSLRQWARFELNGYSDDVDVPRYRLLGTLPIFVDSVSGYTHVTGQVFDRLQLPPKARQFVAETMPMRQPVEELEALAKEDTIKFTNSGLAAAQSMWNGELGPFQQIVGISFKIPGSVVTGILGQIRTQLVDVIAELLADTPMTELPRKESVDAAVGAHIGTQYNTTIHTPQAPLAIGTGAEAVNGVTIDEMLRLLDAVREQAAAEELPDDEVSEILDAVEDLRGAIEQGTASNTGEIVKKTGRLKQLVTNLGAPLLVASTTGAVEAITSAAMAGAFG